MLPAPGHVGSLSKAEIAVDPRTQYRVLVEVLFTLGQRGFEALAAMLARCIEGAAKAAQFPRASQRETVR
jgi:hypothetical protein